MKDRNPTRPELVVTLVTLVLLVASGVSAQRRNNFPAAATLSIVSVSDAQISPDGQWVVYVTKQVTGNEYRNAIWLVRLTVDTNSSATEVERPVPGPNNGTQLVGADWNPSSPRWSRDSKRLAFSGIRGKQVYVCYLSLTDRTVRT
ncbi:MAG: hypothetical protein ABIZ95_10265, partial [Pyrinomonadaceae bacterium]